ncbi:NfrA family protein [Phyllobacterium myrsinacearum]|nr:hypothetical protein [Phyllobacterium myrsinacearum]PWV83643.1 adsorption protein A [Phyllobacterium myrsinacearum]RZV00093.1 adsorption protein A [Phyllobacterium myrsinacearum]
MGRTAAAFGLSGNQHRTRLHSCGLALLLALLQGTAATLPARAQTAGEGVGNSAPQAGSTEDELPLTGPAYEIAKEAYDAFARHDYGVAAARVREAIRQRPDVGRLRTLLVQALAAAGQSEDARREALQAADDPLLSPASRAALKNLAVTDKKPSEPPVNASPAQGSGAPSQATPAYQAADAAYRAYDRRDYDTAVSKAREAVDLDPSNAAYHTLLANALAAQKLAIRQRALDTSAAQASVQSPADRAANAAYAAIRRQRYGEALGFAREAVRRAPDNRNFRLLLIQTLVQNRRQSDALVETGRAISRFGRTSDLLRQRGVLKAGLGDQKGAFDDFSAALQLPGSKDSKRFLRLALADAALASSHPEAAFAALQPFGASAEYAVWIRRGRALQLMKDFAGAEAALARAQQMAATPPERDEVAAARIGLLNAENKKREAAGLFAASRAAGQFATLNTVSLGYLATQAGDDATAHEAFQLAKRKGELHGSQLIDAAYAARRVYSNEEAVSLLHQAIDAQEQGEFNLEPQALFGLRRETADLTREFGAYSTLSYGSSGVSNGTFQPLSNSGRILQLGSEVYWRPPVIGYRDGATFEFFARQFTTLTDSLNGPTGFSTTQGSVGARWKPFSRYNFVLEASKLFKIGKYSRNDTLLRAALSDGFGTDLRVDVPAWWTGQYYAEAGRYVESGQNIANGEARLGRSFRMDSIDDHLVLTPFVAVAANFDSDLANEFALGAGPGLNARYWFREDKYRAPMSYVDLTVQYRVRVAGDDRAGGVFAGLSVAY